MANDAFTPRKPLSPCGRGVGVRGRKPSFRLRRNTPHPNPSPTRGEGLFC
ncbi:hypothetical protein [Azospirillum doebereinerae]